jgi:hypothetical protein
MAESKTMVEPMNASENRFYREPQAPNERYLGDGLYASFDGFYIKLRSPRDGNDHVVYLEPGVFYALHEWGVRMHNDPHSHET